MRTHANDRLEQILFRISMNIELPLTAVLLFLVQPAISAFTQSALQSAHQKDRLRSELADTPAL